MVATGNRSDAELRPMIVKVRMANNRDVRLVVVSVQRDSMRIFVSLESC